MGLRLKFNLMLLGTCLLGLTLASLLAYRMLQQNAREEVLQHARIMIESALAIRGYTAREIHPLLVERLQETFLPQTVSAYAATRNFQVMREKFPEYIYKEAALNPTNPSDRATDWEADIISTFRNNGEVGELVVERETPTGRVLNLARPLTISRESCLYCHSTPDRAPATMLALYGSANGFGWKLGETVGAQIVSVPMAVPLARAWDTFLVFIAALLAVFALVFVLLNLMLQWTVIRPVTKMSQIAEEVSLGKPAGPEYLHPGNDEISSLSRSFNRMRRSLQNALQLLED